MDHSIEKSEKNFFVEVKSIIKTARQNAYSAVNSAMVQAYWLTGRRIVLQEQQGEKRAKYGAYIIKNLSIELSSEFGEGFSERSIREFRQFYLAFSEEEIQRTVSAKMKSNEGDPQNKIRRTTSAEFDFSQSLAAWNLFETTIGPTMWDQLSWSHYKLLMRITSIEARQYYIKETIKNHWAVRTLDRNIATQYYERLLMSQSKDPVISEMQDKTKGFQTDKMEFIKNPSVLEFLNLPSNTGYTEAEIERAIINNLQKFLLELGKGYAFVDRQKLIRTDKRDYFIDLVFYNYILKCFVLIDLKTERISHQDVGQMDMYVRMYDEIEKQDSDNPTLGIVLCSETDEDIARYSILKGNEQIFASKYKLYLPTEEELRAEIEREKLNLRLQLGKGGGDIGQEATVDC